MAANPSDRGMDRAPAVPATTNLQTASGGRSVGATGCRAAGMAGTVMLTVPFGGMIVGALTTDDVAATPGPAALLLDDVREPDGAPAGAAAGAAAAPTVADPDEVPDDPAGVLAAAFARAAAVAAAAAAAPGRAAPVPLAGAVAGLASVTQHAGDAASRSSRQVTAARRRDAIVVMRPSTAPRCCCARPVRCGSATVGLDAPSSSEPSCGREGCRRQGKAAGTWNVASQRPGFSALRCFTRCNSRGRQRRPYASSSTSKIGNVVTNGRVASLRIKRQLQTKTDPPWSPI